MLPGFWMNWERIPTTNAQFGCVIITGHNMHLIASVYGTPCIHIAWVGVEGPCYFVNWAPASIGMLMGFALVSQNLFNIVLM